MKNKILLYLVILVLGLGAPFLFPAFKLQISILWILIILSLTWDVQGGQMGYNTFGNILFFGIGMYLCSSVQIGLFFPLAEWTASGGEKTFVHTPTQFFQGFFIGLILAGIVPALVAAFIGYGILGLRGHYFAICTLGLGIAAGEIAGGIELIGAGQGMTSPPWPKGIGDTELRSEFFYYICFTLMVCTFLFLRWAYQTRFGLVLNAIRDNEDKAEAMGIYTMRYKITGWVVSAFFVGIAGGLMGQQWYWNYRLPGKDGILGLTDLRNINDENPFGMNLDDPNGLDDVLIEGDDLHILLNQPVKINLRSIDVLHDFYIPQFRAKMDMVPGVVTYYWFTPIRTGNFEILCMEYCGTGHYSMRGRVLVDEQKDYEEWLSEQMTFEEMMASIDKTDLIQLALNKKGYK